MCMKYKNLCKGHWRVCCNGLGSGSFRTHLTRKQMYIVQLLYKGGNGFNLFGLKRGNPTGLSISSIHKSVHQLLNPRCHFFRKKLHTSEIPLCFMQIDTHPKPGWASEQKLDFQFSRLFFVCPKDA